MGCDIHSLAEYRTDSHSPWQAAGRIFTEPIPLHGEDGKTSEPFSDRWYALFGLLAGIRVDIEPLAAPRGIPDDCTAQYRAMLDEYGGDAHTPSWLTVTELLAVDLDGYMPGFGIWRDSELGAALPILTTLADNTDDIRVVFFFDN